MQYNRLLRLHAIALAILATLALACAPAASASAPLPPQGVYDACNPATSADGCASRLQRIGSAGFRVVLNGWAFNGLSEQGIRTFAQRAADAGLQVIWPLSALPFQTADPNGSDLIAGYPGISANCGCSTNQGLLAYLVSVLHGLPNTWGYYLADEPGPPAHDALASWASRIKALDPDHPRLIMAGGGNVDATGEQMSWMGNLDVSLGIDSYPVFGGPSDPSHAYQVVKTNVSGLNRVASAAGRSEVVTLQAWRWGDSTADAGSVGVDPSTTRFPTQEEIQAQRDAAVENAKPDLILWFMLTQVIGWEPGQIQAGWSDPPDPSQRWANLVGGAFAPLPVPPPTAAKDPAPAGFHPNQAPRAVLTIRVRRARHRRTLLVGRGTRSRDPDGRIVRYVWRLNGRVVAGCARSRCTIKLRRRRAQRVTLQVFDDRGATGVSRRTLWKPRRTPRRARR